jgi:hypothetical protein
MSSMRPADLIRIVTEVAGVLDVVGDELRRRSLFVRRRPSEPPRALPSYGLLRRYRIHFTLTVSVVS